jgi:signal transduction histidine kinase
VIDVKGYLCPAFSAASLLADSCSTETILPLTPRALRNLIENGLRHGGGKVEVRLSMLGPRAVVRVEDRGPGVPEALRPGAERRSS